MKIDLKRFVRVNLRKNLRSYSKGMKKCAKEGSLYTSCLLQKTGATTKDACKEEFNLYINCVKSQK